MPEEKKEEVDEKELEREAEKERLQEEKAPPKPSGPIGPPVVFNRLARVWCVLAAFFVAGSVYFAAPAGFFLSKPIGFRLGAHVVTQMLIVAAAVFAAGVWAAFRYAGPLLDWQKPGLGRWTRLTAYLGVAFFALFAAFTVHQIPPLKSSWWKDEIWRGTLLGSTFALRPIFFPAIATGALMLLGFHLWANRPKWAEFLAETQSELRKVSWPPHKEWVGSTVVVLVVIAVVSVFLFLVDHGLSRILQELKIGF